MTNYELIEDTIVAVSSPPGAGLRGIVRFSGPGALVAADRVFAASNGRPLGEHDAATCIEGVAGFDDDAPGATAFALVFRGPHSYTGQDLVEIHTAGSPPLLQMILERALAHGARPAGAGEFTARAFLNERLDLSEAEAVASLINASTDAEIIAAERMRHGELSKQTAALRDRLADLLALVEAEIDFTEEPIDFVSPAELNERIGAIRSEIAALLHAAAATEHIQELPRVLLVGPPNAGKSTLLNRLTGVPRAICSPLPGTTRDLLSAPLTVDGREMVLVDSAGLFDAEHPVDAAAVKRTLDEMQHVDGIVLVIDATIAAPPALNLAGVRPSTPRVVATNKIDLVSAAPVGSSVSHVNGFENAQQFPVSALTGEGCDALRAAIGALVGNEDADVSASSLPLTARQRQCLAESETALGRALDLTRDLAATADAAELIAFELREAADAVGRVAGEVSTEELLGRVFSRFCIGK